MTIAEKIKYSADRTKFTLYKEGLFYKCYNEDAMVFVQRVRAYKISSKFVKSIGAEVLSLGFPVSEVEKGNLTLLSISEAIGAESYNEESHGIVFSLKADIKQYYDVFQAEIINVKELNAEKVSDNDTANSKNLVKKIQEFDLANHTPMQCIVFIQELKNQIKIYG